MNRRLELELYGPCTEESELTPQMNDTVATIGENGQVRFHVISGVNMGPEGMVLYATGGERLIRDECYLLYSSDPTSVE